MIKIIHIIDFTIIQKIIEKIRIRTARLKRFLQNSKKTANLKGLFRNPFFYFGLAAFVLFGAIYFSSSSFASFNGLNNSQAAFLNSFLKIDNSAKDTPFFAQGESLALETPDLKIVQGNSIGGVSTTQVFSPKVLGDMLGYSSQNRKDVTEYNVQHGDTLQSIAQNYGISVNTLLWANSLTSSSTIKVGQTLVVLPVDGIIYVVKSGDTISDLGKKYKSKVDDVVAFNGLSDEGDIYIGDVLVLPGGAMPPKATGPVHVEVPLADNFFIFPTQGRISQGLHYYNAVDTSNKCGTPVYAAASGIIQRVKYGYNFGGGNYVTILHTENIATYYGHLMTSFVKPGDRVNVGDRIALMGGATGTVGDGLSTGCHLHFQVMGARNPLVKYPIGTAINLK